MFDSNGGAMNAGFDLSLRRMGRLGRVRRCFFKDPEGHGAGGGGGAGGGSGEPSGGSPSGSADGFSPEQQEKVNSIVRKELEKERTKGDERLKTSQREQLEQINELRSQKDLSENALTALDKTKVELETALMTDREKAVAEATRVQEQHTNALAEANSATELWKGRFVTSGRDSAVLAAASKHGAVSAAQIMAIVAPLAEVVEEVDAKNAGTGRFIVRLPATIKDDKGVAQDKLLNPDDYIAWMKTQPEHENLFLSNKPGGTGFHPSQGGGPSGGAPLTGTAAIASGLGKGQAKQAAGGQVL